MNTTSLTEQIGKIIHEISLKREQIKEDYIKAWLASTVPDEHLNVDWLIQNVELIERRSDDGKTISWSLELKK